jgi:hypothetical protein
MIMRDQDTTAGPGAGTIQLVTSRPDTVIAAELKEKGDQVIAELMAIFNEIAGAGLTVNVAMNFDPNRRHWSSQFFITKFLA